MGPALANNARVHLSTIIVMQVKSCKPGTVITYANASWLLLLPMRAASSVDSITTRSTRLAPATRRVVLDQETGGRGVVQAEVDAVHCVAAQSRRDDGEKRSLRPR